MRPNVNIKDMCNAYLIYLNKTQKFRQILMLDTKIYQ